MRARILTILGTLTLAIGGIAAVSAQAANAQDPQYQYCDGGGYCLNAWNEGPSVNAYAKNHVNNDFYVFANGSYENIEYTGPGSYDGYCIGDYGNSSGDAQAGLSSCENGASGSPPWGGNFVASFCNAGSFSGYSYYNVHWGGYLTPNSDSNGSPYYLNSATVTCYQTSGPG